jgi:hypothetical protein
MKKINLLLLLSLLTLSCNSENTLNGTASEQNNRQPLLQQTQVVATGKTYTTSVGAVFTQVQGPASFGLAWKDPSGLIWSAYQGDYANNQLKPDQNNVVVDSPATEACAKIGGSLPTTSQYQKFASYFDSSDFDEFLSDQGRTDLYTIFPDNIPASPGSARWFWSSSVTSNGPVSSNNSDLTSAFENWGGGTSVYVGLPRSSRFPIHCVASSSSVEVPQPDANTYTTHDSNGNVIAVFTKVLGPSGLGGGFGNAWKDPNGSIWSAYQGEYPNTAIKADQNGVVMDSLATEACTKIGGSLPTIQMYQKLVSYFDLDNKGLLTDQGAKDLAGIFPDLLNDQGYTRFFWSSSVISDYPNDARTFMPVTGLRYDIRWYSTNSGHPRNQYGSVRCIVE